MVKLGTGNYSSILDSFKRIHEEETMMMEQEKSKNNMETYEQLYAQLENLVKRLEVEVLPLDELLRLYEEGVRLVAACQQLLDEAELRVRQLQGQEPDRHL